MVEMMEAEVLVAQSSWHPIGRSVQMTPTASHSPNKTKNMTEFQWLLAEHGIIPAPGLPLGVTAHL